MFRSLKTRINEHVLWIKWPKSEVNKLAGRWNALVSSADCQLCEVGDQPLNQTPRKEVPPPPTSGRAVAAAIASLAPSFLLQAWAG